jgi:predicted nucleic acid-binding protein
MIHLDTNFLVHALWPDTPQDQLLRQWTTAGETLGISVVAWSEFLCGPVDPTHVDLARALVPEPEPLTTANAVLAADFYNVSGRRRGHLVDCFIAATCVRLGASLATHNRTDFLRLQPLGLKLV